MLDTGSDRSLTFAALLPLYNWMDLRKFARFCAFFTEGFFVSAYFEVI
jgi:hypothetical protein